MLEEEIAAFVGEIMQSGFRVVAVGARHYVIDDSHLTKSAKMEARKQLASIRKTYGECDHLRAEIARHLHERGHAIGM